MNTLTKSAVQGAACGLMIGLVLLIGGRVNGLMEAAVLGRWAG